jgi:hypothetical protein
MNFFHYPNFAECTSPLPGRLLNLATYIYIHNNLQLLFNSPQIPREPLQSANCSLNLRSQHQSTQTRSSSLLVTKICMFLRIPCYSAMLNFKLSASSVRETATRLPTDRVTSLIRRRPCSQQLRIFRPIFQLILGMLSTYIIVHQRRTRRCKLGLRRDLCKSVCRPV